MRVYDKGIVVDMADVTWKLLCKATTFVDYDRDTDVEWPDRIEDARELAVNKAMAALNPGRCK